MPPQIVYLGPGFGMAPVGMFTRKRSRLSEMANSKSKARLEKEIEAEIIRLFPEIVQLKTHVKGWPDRLFFLPGAVVIAMELKVPGKPLKEHQAGAKRTLEDLGFAVHRVDSVHQAAAIIGYRM
jgi:hypothetical protein